MHLPFLSVHRRTTQTDDEGYDNLAGAAWDWILRLLNDGVEKFKVEPDGTTTIDGVVTAEGFVGPVTGNLTGNAATATSATAALRHSLVTYPANSSAPGTPGEWAVSGTKLAVCFGPSQWIEFTGGSTSF